jgi:glycosyltransferase involved in cell wall biosynthesis
MACGLSVVASPVGVNNEIVCKGKNGFLADTCETWVNALEKLLRNRLLRQQMGANGRKLVEQKYCIQKMAPRLESLLRSVAASHQ